MTEKLYSRLRLALHHTRLVASQGWLILKENPQIAVYPYLAAIIIIVTFPTVNSVVYSFWNRIDDNSLFLTVNSTPEDIRRVFGFVTFSVFYTAFITSYFTCAVSVDVLDRLDGKRVHLFHGLLVVFRKFFKITKFALVAIFFFPLGILAQRRQHVSTVAWVLGSSFSLQMPLMAPAIVSEKKGLMDSIRHTINTLNKVWAEGILLRVFMIGAIVIISLIGFLPGFVRHWWFDDNSAQLVSWITGLLIWTIGYATVKIVGTVMATSLYYHAKKSK